MNTKITLEQGSGGWESRKLIREIFLSRFRNPLLERLDDAAVLPLKAPAGKTAFTTDSYVVTPLFFPGGDIGKLAVCGTVNDLAVTGARPLYLSCSLIIEEGLELETLEKVADSMAFWARRTGVEIVTGDSKVVERGGADRLYINTAGIGIIPEDFRLREEKIEPGDRILGSGTIAEHGIAVLAAREELDISSQLKSDCRPLNQLTSELVKSGITIKFMRDPTRGGVAAIVNELAEGKEWGILLEEDALPLSPMVRGAVEILGLDPLTLASEGRLVAVAGEEEAGELVEILHKRNGGENARIIGRVTAAANGLAALRTAGGGSRIIDWPRGEPIPRIC